MTVVNRWVEPEWAKLYLERRESIPHRGEGYAAVLELLAFGDPIARVLDLGTGDGHTLGRVLAAHPDAVGVGLDFSTEMLGRARAHFGDDARVEIREHDLDQPLPQELGSFDLVVSSFAIHHCVPERQRALYGEVFDHLAPGGRFVNLEHVASPTPELHDGVPRGTRRGRGPVEQVGGGRDATGLAPRHRVRRRRLLLEVARARAALRPPPPLRRDSPTRRLANEVRTSRGAAARGTVDTSGKCSGASPLVDSLLGYARPRSSTTQPFTSLRTAVRSSKSTGL